MGRWFVLTTAPAVSTVACASYCHDIARRLRSLPRGAANFGNVSSRKDGLYDDSEDICFHFTGASYAVAAQRASEPPEYWTAEAGNTLETEEVSFSAARSSGTWAKGFMFKIRHSLFSTHDTRNAEMLLYNDQRLMLM